MAVRVVINDAAIERFGRGPVVAAVMDRVAGMAVNEMKRLAPVSPVYPVYATRGRTVSGGRRYPGDFPLRPSGYLRTSIRAFRAADGSITVGPTANYGRYVDVGTRPHVIRSHGSWPLRNRATGQTFGQVVHHPGTRAQRFVERTAESLNAVTIHV